MLYYVILCYIMLCYVIFYLVIAGQFSAGLVEGKRGEVSYRFVQKIQERMVDLSDIKDYNIFNSFFPSSLLFSLFGYRSPTVFCDMYSNQPQRGCHGSLYDTLCILYFRSIHLQKGKERKRKETIDKFSLISYMSFENNWIEAERRRGGEKDRWDKR